MKLNFCTAGENVFRVVIFVWEVDQTYHYSTGILAGIWPSGIITLLGELFGSEAKSQVYAMVHTFLYENKDAVTDISKAI